ncbi:FecR family protein [Geofilum sp. OHC36d9]|uniref:FecR family protein n=1 Tax=Geofilum sp. OHC36d9 TaxID=3458413 RepID=UPI0040333D79
MELLEDKTYELMSRILAGEASQDERTVHERRLKDAGYRQMWTQCRMAWQLGHEAMVQQSVDVDEGWRHVKTTLHQTEFKGSLWQRYFRVAAVAALLVFSLVMGVWWFSGVQVHPVEVIVADAKRDVVLPDGSSVTLKQGSTLQYQSDFGKSNRQVSLTGEAFFDVSPDVIHPFIIETGAFSIKVVGTSFNVRTNLDGFSNVDVDGGIVEVAFKRNKAEVIRLQPGEALMMTAEADEPKKLIASKNNWAWKSGQLSFRNETLEQVFMVLQRNYGWLFRVEDASILEEQMGAEFSESDPDYVLQVICKTFNLEAHRENNIVTLVRRN